ncbi:hypothetical protein [Pedobacter panaciterrae]|jgi:hypothetical protein
MTRKSLFAIFLLVSGLMISCNKPEIQPHSSSEKNDEQYVTMSDTLTPGEKHNAIVEEYYAIYGVDTTTDTVDFYTIKTIVTRTAAMFLYNVGEDLDDLNTMVDNEMAEYWDIGMFNPDSTVVPIDSFKVKLAQSLSNGGVRTAWLSILNYNGVNFNDHYNYAETTLGALTGLTAEEVRINDGSLSILGSSYVLFSGMTNETKAHIIADADVLGFAAGWETASNSWWGEINPAAVLTYAHYFSAKCSVMAARMVAFM